MQKLEETKKALIVVRTYPSPATNGAEVSCTAAITDKGEWLRLFPVPWRLLPDDKKFRKYQWVEVRVTKARDTRPESYKLVRDSIQIVSEPLSTKNDWQLRKDVIEPLKAHCLCCLIRKRNADKHPTLSIFRPKKIKRLVIKPTSATWTARQLAILRQGHLFEKSPVKELEKIPYNFQYEFECDDAQCSGHTIICTDWEMGESFRKWKSDYGAEWESKFRQRYENEMIEKRDTHFFMGTMHGHPGTWIIVGLFYPPLAKQELQPILTGLQ
jgi:hypothetical protein